MSKKSNGGKSLSFSREFSASVKLKIEAHKREGWMKTGLSKASRSTWLNCSFYWPFANLGASCTGRIWESEYPHTKTRHIKDSLCLLSHHGQQWECSVTILCHLGHFCFFMRLPSHSISKCSRWKEHTNSFAVWGNDCEVSWGAISARAYL